MKLIVGKVRPNQSLAAFLVAGETVLGIDGLPGFERCVIHFQRVGFFLRHIGRGRDHGVGAGGGRFTRAGRRLTGGDPSCDSMNDF